MGWRVAYAIDQLRKQINSAFPNRSKEYDGTIGDEAHQSRTSDHNPWIKDNDGLMIVSAIDITNDPAHGLSSQKLADALLASRDQRIKYIISNRRIAAGFDGPSPWTWRPYGGSNPHDHHVHVSVEDRDPLYDNPMPWRFDLGPISPDIIIRPPAPERPLLKHGSQGEAVKHLQTLLNQKVDAGLDVDGDFGDKTERAVIYFQRTVGLDPDGKVGAYTWDKLEPKASTIRKLTRRVASKAPRSKSRPNRKRR